MNAVGIFAGRGDVVLGYLVVMVLGVLIGWWVRARLQSFKEYCARRRALKQVSRKA